MDWIACESIVIYRSVLDSVKTNMYVLPCGQDVVVVDPHPDPEVAAYIAGLNPSMVWIYLTHEHPDHTLGVPWLREMFKCQLVCQAKCAERIGNKANNRPLVITLVLAKYDKQHGTHRKEEFVKNFKMYSCQADQVFEKSLSITVGKHIFNFIAAPGHSQGGCCIEIDDKCVLTGDNLILDVPPIFRFAGGNEEEYNSITQPYLDSIPGDKLILPGHGRVFKMKEARAERNKE